MSIKQLDSLVERGEQGKNIGISTGMKKLDKILYGIQRKFIYTIGASSGIGKSSFVLDIFVYNLIKNAGNTPIAILLYSFEMSKEVLQAKLVSRYIWDEFNKVVTYEDILSFSNTISKEHKDLYNKSRPWIEKVTKLTTVYDKPLSPHGVYGTCKEWLRQFGEFITIDDHREDYIEKNPDMYKVVITDHISLLSGPGSKKEKIDLVADYMIYFRNKCGITKIFVQQLNRGVSSVDRKTNGYELVGLEDFKDSSGTTDASEVVIALYSPYREKIARCEGYNIQTGFKSRFILIEVIKNRFGRSGINIGTTFHGEINLFRELPLPNEIGDYSKYTDLIPLEEQICLDKEEKDEENNINIFKF